MQSPISPNARTSLVALTVRTLVTGMLLIAAGCSIFTPTTGRGTAHVNFLNQPDDLCILVGADAAFIVQVTPPEATFQWYKNGVVITNATNSVLVITGVTFADVGLYSCTATASPPVSSREASLSVVGAASTGGGITTVPVSYPYPGSGSSVSGPCGNYIGMVRYPRPGGTSQNFNWIPELGATSVRFFGTTTSIPGLVSTASVLQGYPPRRTCSYGVSSTTASVLGNTGYQFTMYVSAPTSLPKGTPINASVEWRR